MLKLAIQGSTIQYATWKKKSNNNKIEVLTKKLTKLEAELSQGTLFLDTQEQIRLFRHELNELQRIKTDGAIISVNVYRSPYYILGFKCLFNN